MRGLSHVQSTAAVIGIGANHSSHARLQNARISSGRHVKRVHALHGFAWRVYTSSLMLKTAAMFLSNVMTSTTSLPFIYRRKRDF